MIVCILALFAGIARGDQGVPPNKSHAFLDLGKVQVLQGFVTVEFILPLDHVTKAAGQFDKTAVTFMNNVKQGDFDQYLKLIHAVNVDNLRLAEAVTGKHVPTLVLQDREPAVPVIASRDVQARVSIPIRRDSGSRTNTSAASMPTASDKPEVRQPERREFFTRPEDGPRELSHQEQHERSRRQVGTALAIFDLFQEDTMGKKINLNKQAQEEEVNATKNIIRSLETLHGAVVEVTEDLHQDRVREMANLVLSLGSRINKYLYKLTDGLANSRAGHLSIGIVSVARMRQTVAEANELAAEMGMRVHIFDVLTAYDCVATMSHNESTMRAILHLPIANPEEEEVMGLQLVPGPIWPDPNQHPVEPDPRDTVILVDRQMKEGTTMSPGEFARACFRLAGERICEAPVRVHIAATCVGALLLGDTETALLGCPLRAAREEPRVLQLGRFRYLVTAAHATSATIACRARDSWGSGPQGIESRVATRVVNIRGAEEVRIPPNCVLESKDFSIFPLAHEGRLEVNLQVPHMKPVDISGWSRSESVKKRVVLNRIASLAGWLEAANAEVDQASKDLAMETNITNNVLSVVWNQTKELVETTAEEFGEGLRTGISFLTNPAHILSLVTGAVVLLMMVTCLGLVAWQWFKGGATDARDQAVIREAVNNHLPDLLRNILPEVLESQQTRGGPAGGPSAAS